MSSPCAHRKLPGSAPGTGGGVRSQFARNLTLSRLSEAVILPLCPDKGSCMEYDENLAASVYLENDLEMLGRMKKFMV